MDFSLITAQLPLSSIRLHSHRRRLSSSRPSISNFPRASICTTLSLDLASVVVDDGARSMPKKILLKGMDFPDLEKWVESHGFRSGQALALWKRLYGDNVWAQCTDELTGLSKDFKEMLAVNASFNALSVKDVIKASDGTRKILFSLEDGMVIETVVIPTSGGRTTVCVSSQVGCAMNCQFCYTGRMGLKKNLTAAEIVEQVIFAQRLLTSDVGSITNVVFMGMGEPFHNLDNVMKAASIMVNDKGLHFSHRKVTVSTSGLVPQMKRFLRESNCALAVRNWIMPINRKYNLKWLLDTLKEELHSKDRYKVLFEYVMLEGINDSMDDAKRLVNLVHGIPCKINLISFNRHKGSFFEPSSNEKMAEFRNLLAEAGCIVLLRPSRGDDQMAACGQLGDPGNFQAPLLSVPDRFQTVVE
ncbi:Ribosomal RNA large subunit methyltransferase N [Zostera marina]|uniref:Ribosomal RNA large subunit methyltransferase N n=1 Tax=Zostera marina TaxID=29655 RepID=A0A0K9PQT5_ZOSMR|nr:Ribosomal RNA large subunit methyltransferase N [Zostera marina]